MSSGENVSESIKTSTPKGYVYDVDYSKLLAEHRRKAIKMQRMLAVVLIIIAIAAIAISIYYTRP